MGLSHPHLVRDEAQAHLETQSPTATSPTLLLLSVPMKPHCKQLVKEIVKSGQGTYLSGKTVAQRLQGPDFPPKYHTHTHMHLHTHANMHKKYQVIIYNSFIKYQVI